MYATAVRSYRDYCTSRGWPCDAPIRGDWAREWLTSLGEAGALSAATIAVYKSALHTQAELEGEWPNPLNDPLTKRLLTGIANSKAETEQAKRAARPRAQPLTFDVVLELRSVHDSSPRDVMMFAATALGVNGCFRPSEMLGSSKLPGRRLRAEQVQFFSGKQQLLPQSGSSATPSSCTVTLEVSKTDQQRRGRVRHVSASAAVQAAWRWACLSGAHGPAAFFALDGKPLTMSALQGHLRRRLALIGRSDLHFTGRSLRKGGASTLSALGVEAEDIARVAWTPGSGVWSSHYANDPMVREERAKAVSRHMEAALPQRLSINQSL